jgi:hypothetical protein
LDAPEIELSLLPSGIDDGEQVLSDIGLKQRSEFGNPFGSYQSHHETASPESLINFRDLIKRFTYSSGRLMK